MIRAEQQGIVEFRRFNLWHRMIRHFHMDPAWPSKRTVFMCRKTFAELARETRGLMSLHVSVTKIQTVTTNVV